jgi:alkanesulfonate monooxygenase SsuD/methylene tetrahydromethanopterin reductase-like flavin-dependent oxidoreductase (luciferase family)
MLPAGEVGGVTPGWPVIRSFAMGAEERGLDSVWMFDHFFNMEPGGSIEGMHEAWTVVSAVAAVTRRVEIGTLVCARPFATRASWQRWRQRRMR